MSVHEVIIPIDALGVEVEHILLRQARSCSHSQLLGVYVIKAVHQKV